MNIPMTHNFVAGDGHLAKGIIPPDRAFDAGSPCVVYAAGALRDGPKMPLSTKAASVVYGRHC